VERLQRYRLVLTRGTDGEWSVRGYWETEKGSFSDQDGATLRFKSRAELAEHLAKAQGIPE
jgi:hypothetical protein